MPVPSQKAGRNGLYETGFVEAPRFVGRALLPHPKSQPVTELCLMIDQIS